MRKRMRGLYNGFDSYVGKVSTLLNYIPALQNQIETVEVSFRFLLVNRENYQGTIKTFGDWYQAQQSSFSHKETYLILCFNQQGQLRGVRGEIESVRREVASGGGQTVVYRDGGGGSGEVSAYIENRIVQLESSLGNVKSDLR